MQYHVYLESEPGYKTVQCDKIRCNSSVMVGLDNSDNVLWAVALRTLKWIENA